VNKYMGLPVGRHLSNLPTHVCGMCVWHVCVACVCGMCVWHVCVACVCGVRGVCAARVKEESRPLFTPPPPLFTRTYNLPKCWTKWSSHWSSRPSTGLKRTAAVVLARTALAYFLEP